MHFMILPLSFISKKHYRLAISWTERCFGVLITSVCQWWSPTTIRVSGDDSVPGQIRQTPDGLLECHFPERLVLIANHQVGARASNVSTASPKVSLMSARRGLIRSSSTRTGFICGGSRTPTVCMATSTSSSRSRSSISPYSDLA